MLKFSVLSSGSSGNAIYVETETTRLLLDAGISGKQLQQRLTQTTESQLKDIDALLVTHEHIDHVRGLRQAIRQSSANLHITRGTWSHVEHDLAEHVEAARLNFVEDGKVFTIGNLRITPFAVSHDAEEPVAYRFDTESESLTVITDLGYMSDRIKTVIKGCQCYVLESNHDVDMLRAGRYPWSIKRRILGDKGHLSNYDAAVALSDLLATDEVEVYLAHLSEENNLPELAELTAQTTLQDIQPRYLEQVRLHRTSRAEATPLHVLGAVAKTPV